MMLPSEGEESREGLEEGGGTGGTKGSRGGSGVQSGGGAQGRGDSTEGGSEGKEMQCGGGGEEKDKHNCHCLERANHHKAKEVQAEQSTTKGKGKALLECTRCMDHGLQCELRPGKSTFCMACQEGKLNLKCEWKRRGSQNARGNG